MKRVAESIFANQVNLLGSAGLKNPWVKALVLSAPILVVVYQQVGRAFSWHRFTITELLLMALCFFCSATINLSERERPRFLRRVFVWGGFTSLAFYVLQYPDSQLSALFGVFSKTFSSIPILNDVAAESWVLLLYFVVMVIAVSNFSTREAFWLGRKLLWSWAFRLYAVTVTVHAAINSALPLRVRMSHEISRDKVLLLRNPYRSDKASWMDRARSQIWIFASTLIMHNSQMALAIESLMNQRGLFRKSYRDAIGVQIGGEDVVALCFLFIAAFMVVLQRL